jgi:hypothetical protein
MLVIRQITCKPELRPETALKVLPSPVIVHVPVLDIFDRG